MDLIVIHGKYLNRSRFLTHGQLCTGLNKGFLRLNSSTIQLASQSSIDTLSGNITTINNEISSLKSSVSNGKSLIAAAVTDKGVPTAASDSFTTMSNNIRKINDPVPVQSLPEGYTQVNYILTDGKAYINSEISNQLIRSLITTTNWYQHFSMRYIFSIPNADTIPDISYLSNAFNIFGNTVFKIYCYKKYTGSANSFTPKCNENDSNRFTVCLYPVATDSYVINTAISTLSDTIIDYKLMSSIGYSGGNYYCSMRNYIGDTSTGNSLDTKRLGNDSNPFYFGRGLITGMPKSIPSKIYLFNLSYCPKDITVQEYNPATDIVEYSNMVPCINPSGEVGMYDTIRQRFFGNANTEGSFTYG